MSDNILQKDTSAARGSRTTLQAIIGLPAGLALAIWAVPGVPDAIWNYLTTNIPTFLAAVGIPAVTTGIVSYIWNKMRGVK